MLQKLQNNAYVHGLVSAILFGLSYAVMHGGGWQTITLGAIATYAYNYLFNWNNGLTAGGSPK